MLVAKWAMDGLAGTNWHFDELNAGGLFAQIDPLTDKLENGLLDFFSTTNGRCNFEVYERTLRLGFLPKHAKQILESLTKRNRIRVELINGRKGAFYLSYKDFSSKTRKIEIFKVN